MYGKSLSSNPKFSIKGIQAQVNNIVIKETIIAIFNVG